MNSSPSRHRRRPRSSRPRRPRRSPLPRILRCRAFRNPSTHRACSRAVGGFPYLLLGRRHGVDRGRAAAPRRHLDRSAIDTKIGSHGFRATGITAYLKKGGTLEKAAAMANHASTRNTQLYDRRRDDVSLDEVEKVVI